MLSWEYIAGFFDGEGCVTVSGTAARGQRRRAETRVKIQITQTGQRGKDLFDEMAIWLKERGIACKFSRYVHRNPLYRVRWVLMVNSRDSQLRFIEGILPYCYIKKTELQDCLRLMKLYPADKSVRSFLMKEHIMLAKEIDPSYMVRCVKGTKRKLAA